MNAYELAKSLLIIIENVSKTEDFNDFGLYHFTQKGSCSWYEFANEIFNNSDNQSGSDLVLGAIFFSMQIYGDFSGYSDIALGTARLFGIELLNLELLPAAKIIPTFI